MHAKFLSIFLFMGNVGNKSLPALPLFPGAAEVEVTMQQQLSTHVKMNLAHLLHLDNE